VSISRCPDDVDHRRDRSFSRIRPRLDLCTTSRHNAFIRLSPRATVYCNTKRPNGVVRVTHLVALWSLPRRHHHIRVGLYRDYNIVARRCNAWYGNVRLWENYAVPAVRRGVRWSFCWTQVTDSNENFVDIKIKKKTRRNPICLYFGRNCLYGV